VFEPNAIRIGTSSFTASGWKGTFYPEGVPEREYLTYYATKFDTVEVDSTFYRSPSVSTVKGWNAKTPRGFVFAAKVPQVITHDNLPKNIGPLRQLPAPVYQQKVQIYC
jgi:uncharacterized protein YecE (DUF72 family)